MPKSPKAPAKRITLSQIAEHCGVSRQVVSTIVSGRDQGSVRFSEETRRRVLQAIEDHGYRPNRTVMGFFRKRHGSIGVLAHTPYTISQDTLAFMMSTGREHDQMIMIEHLDDVHEPRMVAEDCVDGLILFETIDEGLMAQIERYQLPVVQVNTNHRFGPGCITFDDEAAAAEAAEAFHAAGRRHPAVMGNGHQHYSGQIRYEMFRRTALGLGLSDPPRGPAMPGYEDDYTAEPTTEFLAAHPELDCLLLTVDEQVASVLDACRTLGRRVPEDLALIGFNNSNLAKTLRPGLTSFGVDAKQLGVQAVQMLNELLAGQTPEPLVLPYRLYRRETL